METSSSSTITITHDACSYCGLYHSSGMCPRVKAIEHHRDGSVKRVEFFGDDGQAHQPAWVHPVYSPVYPSPTYPPNTTIWCETNSSTGVPDWTNVTYTCNSYE